MHRFYMDNLCQQDLYTERVEQEKQMQAMNIIHGQALGSRLDLLKLACIPAEMKM